MKALIRIRHMRARAGKWEQHILLSILLVRSVSAPQVEVHHFQSKKDLHYGLRHCHNNPTALNRRQIKAPKLSHL